MPRGRAQLARAALVVATLTWAADARAGVSVVVEAPASIAQRIQNQLSDLAIDVRVVSPAGPSAEPSVLDRARALATRSSGSQGPVGSAGSADARGSGGVDVAVLVEPVGTGAAYQLHVADLRSSRVSSRVLGRDRAASGSALDETVALAVRSAIQALTLGGAHDGPLDGEPEPSAPLDVPLGTRPTEPVPRDRVGLRASVGALVGLGGGEAPLFGALTAHVGVVVLPRVELGVGGALGTSRALSDALTSIDVTRHSVLGSAALTLYQGTGVQLDSALLAGVVLHHRVTEALAAGVVAEAPSTAASFAAGLELRGRWVVVDPWAVELVAGVDLVPGAPILTYRRGPSEETRDVLAIVQPRVGLGVSFAAR